MATASINNILLDEEIQLAVFSSPEQAKARGKERSKTVLSAHLMRTLAATAPQAGATDKVQVVSKADAETPSISPMALAIIMSLMMGKIMENLGIQAKASSDNLTNQGKISDALTDLSQKNLDAFKAKLKEYEDALAEQERANKVLSIFGYIIAGLSVLLAGLTGGLAAGLACVAITALTMSGSMNDDGFVGKAISSAADTLASTFGGSAAGWKCALKIVVIAAATAVAPAGSGALVGMQLLAALNPTYDITLAIADAVPGGSEEDKKMYANISAMVVNFAISCVALKFSASTANISNPTLQTAASWGRNALVVMTAVQSCLMVWLGSIHIKTGDIQQELATPQKKMILLQSSTDLVQTHTQSDLNRMKTLSDSYGRAVEGMTHVNDVMRYLVEKM